MAFHVACPITCRKICFCALGFRGKLRSEKGKNEFLEEVDRVEQFLRDPWLIKAKENATIQVKVPKVVASPAPPQAQIMAAPAVAVGGEDAVAAASAQVKRVALQKRAAAASMVAEDYARKFESGDLATRAEDNAGEEQAHSNAKVMCRLCFRGENEGSDRAKKMLSCNSCGKKYHRSCVKGWSQNRDLFHWSSWTCPSCRTCEVCRRTGDPNKFMFCKRCDAACHCYCQQPPHKNVGHGPYLCPKHTKCHSCGSSVPGNGLSVRWLLGYTCCDACGRLFMKDNYCPVCLKVYRDSESTPMVCCDICEKWVHCTCDGISDAKYNEFQVDGNLQYVCPTCRGKCCQIRNLEEAVQELWRRRDEADRDMIASLRAAAGLPTQEEIFDISPFSDDEDGGPVFPSKAYGRSLKFSLKGVGDNSPRKSKEYGKKSSKKKYGKNKGNGTSLDSRTVTNQSGVSMFGYDTGDIKNEEMQFPGEPDTSFPAMDSLTKGVCSVNEAALSKHKHVEEVTATYGTKPSRTINVRSNKPHDLGNKEDIGTPSSVPETAPGPKLVIHLGGRNRNIASPRSESASFRKEQDLSSSNGTKNMNQLEDHECIDMPGTATKFEDKKGHKFDRPDQLKAFRVRETDSHLIELKNSNPEAPGGESADGYDSISPKKTQSLLGKRAIEDIGSEVPATRKNKYPSVECVEDRPIVSGDLIDDNSRIISSSQALEKDLKPYLKFKIPKSTNIGNQSASSNVNTETRISLSLPGKDEITYTRGQRSKRKRPEQGDVNASQRPEDNTMKDFTDANWILQRLGKDAAGKRVEIHQPSNNSWHRGTVNEVFEGTSIVSISLDDGKAKHFELGKQGIRFVSQKQMR